MSDIITWLIGVETSAANLYEEAAIVFSGDEGFSRLLSRMAVEEREHEKLMQQASASITDDEMKGASFSFDDEFRSKIEAPFSRAWCLLKDGALTKTAMVDILVEAEFSEWNEVFLYTLDVLNVSKEEIQTFVSDVEQHRVHIQEYITSLPDGDRLFQRIRKLSQTGGKRVLIVENNHAVARMLEALAGDQVEVVLARDGQEGLFNIRQKHFDLIVSEIELPNMNGLEMYQQALAIDPSLYRRFMFFTGTENREYLDFVRSSNLSMLPKPSPVRLIRAMMNELLDVTSVPQGSTIH